MASVNLHGIEQTGAHRLVDYFPAYFLTDKNSAKRRIRPSTQVSFPCRREEYESAERDYLLDQVNELCRLQRTRTFVPFVRSIS